MLYKIAYIISLLHTQYLPRFDKVRGYCQNMVAGTGELRDRGFLSSMFLR